MLFENTEFLIRNKDEHIYVLSQSTARKLYRVPRIELSSLEIVMSVFSFLLFFGGLAATAMMMFVALFYLIFFQSVLAGTYLALFTLATMYPRRLHAWPSFIRDNMMWRYWRGYFSFISVVPDDVFDGGKNRFIFGCHPHGIFPMGQWLTQSIASQYVLPHLRYIKGATADSCLKAPLMRQLYGWFGLISAQQTSIEEHMKLYNIALIPGGIAELFYSNADEETLYLRKRNGFFKLALKNDFDLIPVYVFGNTQIYHRFSTGKGILTYLSRKFKTTVTWFYGYWGTPIPKHRQIVACYGHPIRVDHIEDPTYEDIEELKNRYIEALEELFDEYKHLVGWENKTLKII